MIVPKTLRRQEDSGDEAAEEAELRA